MGSLFGGSKSKSYNKAWDQINSSMSPLLGYASKGASGLDALLGGNTTGLDNFKKSMGYDWSLGQGLASVVAGNAVKGLRNSGATLKGLADYQTNLNSKYGANYLDLLTNLTQTGMNAGQLMTSAGQYSKSSTSAGLGPLLGAAGSIFAGGAKF